MFGFVFAKNFDSPYRSASITEFWQRWHISLVHLVARISVHSAWRQPQGGPTRTAVNLAIVMLLGGLWHGASWNFVMWGAIHGLLLGSERMLGKKPFYAALPKGIADCRNLYSGAHRLGVFPGGNL
jgi:alginate O-acetyltransferase complex protein AlgI